ncbi:Uncharacterized protein QTN25_003357 [Entamoeba marina]
MQAPRKYSKRTYVDEKNSPYGFYNVRNYQAQQEGIFIVLLNQEYDITIEAPQKKSVVSLNYLRIHSVSNSNETIEFGNVLMRKLKEMYDEDLVNMIPEKTASRRFEINRIAESIHLQMSMLKKFGYQMATSAMGKRNVRESVISINIDGISLDKNTISSRGEIINKVIMERMKTLQRKGRYTIPRGDTELMALLLG